MSNNVPQSGGIATADDAAMLITFGDFTLEETERVLHQATVEEDAKTSAKAPKSWAEALGVPKAEPVAKLAPWATAAAPVGVANEGEATAEHETKAPVSFEVAIQDALGRLKVTEPVNEMKKRGLVNQGNTCFQNVIMQSLLACPPFLNLLVDISGAVAPTQELLSNKASFKVWRHILAFAREFEEPTLAQLQARMRSGQGNGFDGKTPKAIKISGYFMDVLSEFQKMRGEQEDALEFLEFFLDYLHSEYEKSGLELPPSCEKQTKHTVSASAADQSQDAAGGWGDFDDGWAEVGKRGKSSVLRQNPVDATRSPINWLFKGSLRSELKHNGKKQSSITIEPFHCLHLNLELDQQDPSAVVGSGIGNPTKTYTIDEMIRKAFAVEEIEGVDASSSMRRFVSMETLPVVLTMNIKRFTYHPEHGPVKLQQFVKYPAYFEFPTQFMSSTCRAENGADLGKTGSASSTNGQGDDGFTYPPRYELFAVVSHLGKFIVGGHYTCVCRDNKDQWFRYNDEHVLSITEAAALSETAYLLFYIRTNRPPPPPPKPAPGSVNLENGTKSKSSKAKGGKTSNGNAWGHHQGGASRKIPGMTPVKKPGKKK